MSTEGITGEIAIHSSTRLVPSMISFSALTETGIPSFLTMTSPWKVKRQLRQRKRV
jgi:hypothetical protein